MTAGTSRSQIVLQTLAGASRRMESRAKHPISHLLVVNHDARFWEKCHEAVLNSKFDGGRAAVVRTPCMGIRAVPADRTSVLSTST